MEIKVTEDRIYIDCPYQLKDSLKRAIPSAKWDGTKKLWSVGKRCKKKLETWAEENKKAEEEALEKREAYRKKVAKMVELTGRTFDIKDELKERFDAEFHTVNFCGRVTKAWFVSPEVSEDAQAFVDAHNKKRLEKSISKEDVDCCVLAIDYLSLLEKAINNFNPETGLYKYNDDYLAKGLICDFRRDDVATHKELRKRLIFVGQELNKYLTFADENDNPGLFFDLDLSDILRVLGLPRSLVIDFYKGKVVDYCDIERQLVFKKLSNNEYLTTSSDQASKELDDAHNPPKYTIFSEVSQLEYDITDRVDIERVRSSGRVHIYTAKNIPVLNDANFKTRVYYWRNKPRCGFVTIEDD